MFVLELVLVLVLLLVLVLVFVLVKVLILVLLSAFRTGGIIARDTTGTSVCSDTRK